MPWSIFCYQWEKLQNKLKANDVIFISQNFFRILRIMISLQSHPATPSRELHSLGDVSKQGKAKSTDITCRPQGASRKKSLLEARGPVPRIRASFVSPIWKHDTILPQFHFFPGGNYVHTRF